MFWVICLKINQSILCNERFKHYQGNFKIENYCRNWDESQTGTPQPLRGHVHGKPVSTTAQLQLVDPESTTARLDWILLHEVVTSRTG